MNIFEEFEHFESETMCARNRAGMTKEQMTGASLFWGWLQTHYPTHVLIAPPVLQPWVLNLTFMQQSVLLAAVRGPDGIKKNHIAKVLLRWYRRCILYTAFERKIFKTPYEAGGGSFTGPCTLPDIDDCLKEYVRTLDELPHHFQLHFMHAAEILGYKHPDGATRGWWCRVYMTLAADMHLNPETQDQMEKRLGDSERQWRAAEVVTAD